VYAALEMQANDVVSIVLRGFLRGMAGVAGSDNTLDVQHMHHTFSVSNVTLLPALTPIDQVLSLLALLVQKYKY
jgi:hypothetical protein